MAHVVPIVCEHKMLTRAFVEMFLRLSPEAREAVLKQQQNVDNIPPT